MAIHKASKDTGIVWSGNLVEVTKRLGMPAGSTYMHRFGAGASVALAFNGDGLEFEFRRNADGDGGYDTSVLFLTWCTWLLAFFGETHGLGRFSEPQTKSEAMQIIEFAGDWAEREDLPAEQMTAAFRDGIIAFWTAFVPGESLPS